MDRTNMLIWIALFVGVGMWLLPAVILTMRISKEDKLPKPLKKQLIKGLWLVPLVGNIVGYMFFSKIGKLTPLTESEHRSLWVAYKSTR